MKFAYEDLSDDQFESLIVFLCQRLLGISVQGFAKEIPRIKKLREGKQLDHYML